MRTGHFTWLWFIQVSSFPTSLLLSHISLWLIISSQKQVTCMLHLTKLLYVLCKLIVFISNILCLYVFRRSHVGTAYSIPWAFLVPYVYSQLLVALLIRRFTAAYDISILKYLYLSRNIHFIPFWPFLHGTLDSWFLGTKFNYYKILKMMF